MRFTIVFLVCTISGTVSGVCGGSATSSNARVARRGGGGGGTTSPFPWQHQFAPLPTEFSVVLQSATTGKSI